MAEHAPGRTRVSASTAASRTARSSSSDRVTGFSTRAGILRRSAASLGATWGVLTGDHADSYRRNLVQDALGGAERPRHAELIRHGLRPPLVHLDHRCHPDIGLYLICTNVVPT